MPHFPVKSGRRPIAQPRRHLSSRASCWSRTIMPGTSHGLYNAVNFRVWRVQTLLIVLRCRPVCIASLAGWLAAGGRRVVGAPAMGETDLVVQLVERRDVRFPAGCGIAAGGNCSFAATYGSFLFPVTIPPLAYGAVPVGGQSAAQASRRGVVRRW